MSDQMHLKMCYSATQPVFYVHAYMKDDKNRREKKIILGDDVWLENTLQTWLAVVEVQTTPHHTHMHHGEPVYLSQMNLCLFVWPFVATLAWKPTS